MAMGKNTRKVRVFADREKREGIALNR